MTCCVCWVLSVVLAVVLLAVQSMPTDLVSMHLPVQQTPHTLVHHTLRYHATQETQVNPIDAMAVPLFVQEKKKERNMAGSTY